MNLIKMNPSRKKPKEGDVFVIHPLKEIYFYGLVIKTKIPNKDPMIDGGHLIFIYDLPTKKIDLPKNLESNQLLIPPKIVNNQGWLKGYFQTIGSISINKEKVFNNYGFWDILTKQFVDEEGNPLAIKPIIYGDYGLGSYGSVSHDITETLGNSPEILDKIK